MRRSTPFHPILPFGPLSHSAAPAHDSAVHSATRRLARVYEPPRTAPPPPRATPSTPSTRHPNHTFCSLRALRLTAAHPAATVHRGFFFSRAVAAPVVGVVHAVIVGPSPAQRHRVLLLLLPAHVLRRVIFRARCFATSSTAASALHRWWWSPFLGCRRTRKTHSSTPPAGLPIGGAEQPIPFFLPARHRVDRDVDPVRTDPDGERYPQPRLQAGDF